jgi:membrane protein DedA with SNARE-associated domain
MSWLITTTRVDKMKFWKFGLPAAVACLACCAPLIAPFFAGSALAGFGVAGYFQSLEMAMVVPGLGLIGYWFYRRKQQAEKSCACAADAGCNIGNSCNTP